jgi:hypothetical protein
MKLLACLCKGGRKKKQTSSSVQRACRDVRKATKGSRTKDGDMVVFVGATAAVVATTSGGCGGGCGGGGCGGGGCGF